MRSPSSLLRPAAALATVALAAGAAGCGGGGDKGGDSSYASTWNEVCQSITTTGQSLQTDFGDAAKKGGGQKAIQRRMIKPTTKALDTIVSALERVKDLDAPSDLSSFQDKVKASAPDTITFFKKIRGPVESGDAKAFQSSFARLGQGNAFPKLPAKLKKDASACSAF